MNNLTEKHIQAIWYDPALRPSDLCTCDGRKVNVIHPGEWNLEAGPDFQHAVLEIGDAHYRVTGDVEIHICPNDWDFHKHGSDPRYHNVIAHVTWQGGSIPKSLPHNALSIWLGHLMAKDKRFSLDQIDLSAYPYAQISNDANPCTTIVGKNHAITEKALRLAGEHRLRMKSRRIAGRIGAARGNRRQIFYEEIMMSLGYKNNSTQFRHIAERIPIDCMPIDREIAESAMTVASSFEAFIRSGCRPNNAPERRIMNAAGIFTDTQIMKLIDATNFSKESCENMLKIICKNHYIGKARAASILANVIVPFALAEDRINSIPQWLPPEDISRPIKVMATRLLGRDHNPVKSYSKNNILIHGLLQLYRDCCKKFQMDCGKCTKLWYNLRKLCLTINIEPSCSTSRKESLRNLLSKISSISSRDTAITNCFSSPILPPPKEQSTYLVSMPIVNSRMSNSLPSIAKPTKRLLPTQLPYECKPKPADLYPVASNVCANV